jgi:hypothetical protein
MGEVCLAVRERGYFVLAKWRSDECFVVTDMEQREAGESLIVFSHVQLLVW